MTSLKIKFEQASHPRELLLESIEQILNANELCAMSVVAGEKSHIFTAYFVYDDNLSLYFLSQPADVHSTAITMNPSIAVAVWNQSTQWGTDLQGIQFFGECSQLTVGLELVHAMALFSGRFHAFSKIIKAPGTLAEGVTSRVYKIQVRSIKLLDEPRFGRRQYVHLNVQNA